MRLKFVDREWGCAGADHWQIFGNTERKLSSCGYFDKFAHLVGHFLAVMLFRYYFNIPILWLIIGSVSFGILYEIIWNGLTEGSGISKYDIIANIIGTFTAILCILVKGLIDTNVVAYKLFPYVIVVGFLLTFTYKVWKLKRR